MLRQRARGQPPALRVQGTESRGNAPRDPVLRDVLGALDNDAAVEDSQDCRTGRKFSRVKGEDGGHEGRNEWGVGRYAPKRKSQRIKM